MQRAITTLSCFIIFQQASAQIEIIPIQRTPREDLKITNTGRTKDVELTLPFWDDFSNGTSGAADENLWQAGRSVWLNQVMGINPPSLGIITLDGLDSLGHPYSINDVLAKGFADRIVSHIIRMDSVPVADRSSVYFSLFFQLKGRGESPDAGDQLSVSFYDADGNWVVAWTAENDGSQDPATFYQVIVPVTDDKFYHDKFRFRLQNFARLSGPYDTWHVDYIYLNKGRNLTDLSYPDRTIAEPFSNLFGPFRAIPMTHFLEDPSANISAPSIFLTNLRADQVRVPFDNTQPINYTTTATLTTWKDSVATSQPPQLLDDGETIGSGLAAYEKRLVTISQVPDLANMAGPPDSARVKIHISLETKDNLLTTENGDYDKAKYEPLEFRLNDSTSVEYTLSDYYAYDDGTAEYGAALNRQGAQMAYQFDLVGVDTASVVSLDLYFPRFGDESSQVIELRLWKALTDDPLDLLYKEIVTLQRAEQNRFWRKKLLLPVRVEGTFYVGWRQSSSAVIAVGLDKNTDSGAKMFSNTTGTWVNNIQLQGSLMMRPILGAGIKPPTTGLADEVEFVVYPNPCSGSFFFEGHAERLVIYDITGRAVDFTKEEETHRTKVSLSDRAPGMFIVRMLNGEKMSTTKVMVR